MHTKRVSLPVSCDVIAPHSEGIQLPGGDFNILNRTVAAVIKPQKKVDEVSKFVPEGHRSSLAGLPVNYGGICRFCCIECLTAT